MVMPRARIPIEQATGRTLARRRKALGLVKPHNPPASPELFQVWSDHLAWLMGLIWSDGYLHTNSVFITTKDFQVADLVLSLVEGSLYRLHNRGRHLRVSFTNKTIADFLRSYGLFRAKSLTIGFPPIPEEYTGHFMRGLIDGDGSVMIRQKRKGQRAPDLIVQLVTASPFLRDGVANWFTRRNIRFSLTCRQQGNPLWRFTIVQQRSLRKLFRILYPSDDIACLHRKYAPYVYWMNAKRAPSGNPKLMAKHSKATRARKKAQAARAAGQIGLFDRE